MQSAPADPVAPSPAVQLYTMGFTRKSARQFFTQLLDRYKKRRGSWAEYETEFLDLMAQRRIEESLSPELLDGGCLLCSEPTPDQCHRRLVAEYLVDKWGTVTIQHL